MNGTLVARLRRWARIAAADDPNPAAAHTLYGEAADEIERLRAALASVAELTEGDRSPAERARAALAIEPEGATEKCPKCLGGGEFFIRDHSSRHHCPCCAGTGKVPSAGPPR